jgi:two-component system NtrC family response regulator
LKAEIQRLNHTLTSFRDFASLERLHLREIDVQDVLEDVTRLIAPQAAPLETAVAEAEKTAILTALEHCDHHRERTAQTLGISVRTLHYKMNRYSLQ